MKDVGSTITLFKTFRKEAKVNFKSNVGAIKTLLAEDIQEVVEKTLKDIVEDFICLISSEFISKPMRLNTHRARYQQSFLEEWLAISKTCPLTREKICAEKLIYYHHNYEESLKEIKNSYHNLQNDVNNINFFYKGNLQKTKQRLHQLKLDLSRVSFLLALEDLIPRDFRCPISREVIKHAVRLTTHKQCYTFTALKNWIANSNYCPMTEKKVDEKSIRAAPAEINQIFFEVYRQYQQIKQEIEKVSNLETATIKPIKDKMLAFVKFVNDKKNALECTYTRLHLFTHLKLDMQKPHHLKFWHEQTSHILGRGGVPVKALAQGKVYRVPHRVLKMMLALKNNHYTSKDHLIECLNKIRTTPLSSNPMHNGFVKLFRSDLVKILYSDEQTSIEKLTIRNI